MITYSRMNSVGVTKRNNQEIQIDIGDDYVLMGESVSAHALDMMTDFTTGSHNLFDDTFVSHSLGYYQITYSSLGFLRINRNQTSVILKKTPKGCIFKVFDCKRDFNLFSGIVMNGVYIRYNENKRFVFPRTGIMIDNGNYYINCLVKKNKQIMYLKDKLKNEPIVINGVLNKTTVFAQFGSKLIPENINQQDFYLKDIQILKDEEIKIDSFLEHLKNGEMDQLDLFYKRGFLYLRELMYEKSKLNYG